jgi:hypothetical protein
VARLYALAREDWRSLSDAIVSEYADFTKAYAQMGERAEAAGDKEAARIFRACMPITTKPPGYNGIMPPGIPE